MKLPRRDRGGISAHPGRDGGRRRPARPARPCAPDRNPTTLCDGDVTVVVEPPGDNCEFGGIKVVVVNGKPDDEPDGDNGRELVDADPPDPPDDVFYVCNGAPGAPGEDGEDGEDGEPGAVGADRPARCPSAPVGPLGPIGADGRSTPCPAGAPGPGAEACVNRRRICAADPAEPGTAAASVPQVRPGTGTHQRPDAGSASARPDRARALFRAGARARACGVYPITVSARGRLPAKRIWVARGGLRLEKFTVGNKGTGPSPR